MSVNCLENRRSSKKLLPIMSNAQNISQKSLETFEQELAKKKPNIEPTL
jgi:hypothetical protein